MNLYNVKTGELEKVADPTSAVLNGTHAPKSTDTFRYINPEDNKTYETPGSQLFDSLSRGAILETPELAKDRELEKSFANRPFTAAALAGARGLTFGLSDLAINATLGDAAAEAVKEIEDRNPVASITGEVGGIIIPTLLSGGTSLIANAAKGSTTLLRGATRASESVAAKIVENQLGKKVLGSAIEGAAYGAGQSVSEAALGRPDHTAENLLIGGGFSAGIPVLGAVGKALTGDIARKGLAIGATFGSTKTKASDMFKFLENTEEGFLKRELVSKGAGQIEEVRKKAVDLAEKSDLLAREASKYFKDTKFAKAEELLKDMPFEQVQSEANRVQQQMLETVMKMRERPAIYSGPAVGKLELLADDAAERLSAAKTSSELFKTLDEVKSELYVAAKAGGAPTGAETEALREVGSLANSLKESLEDPKLWGEAGTLQQKLNSSYSTFVESQKAFQQNFMRKFGDSYTVDPKKIVSFLKKPYAEENVLKAEAFNSYFENANILRGELDKAGANLSKEAMSQGEMLGSFKAMKEDAKALTDFGRLEGTLNDVWVLKGITPQRMITTLAWMEKQTAKVNEQWKSNLNQAFKGLTIRGPLSIKSAVTDRAETEEEMKRMQEIAGDPVAATEAITSFYNPVRAAAPQIAEGLTTQTMAAASFLAGKVPKNPFASVLGVQDDWKPSDQQMAAYRRYSAAVSNPMTLLEEIKSGQVNPETVEAVQAVYPNFYEKTVGALTQYIGEKKVKIPYQRRLELANLFKIPTDESLKPINAASLQLNFQKKQQQGRPKSKQIQGFSQAAASAGDELQK